MMADVACFCGCLYFFQGAAGACPTCGEVARVTAGTVVDGIVCGQPERPAAQMNGAGPERATSGAGLEWAKADPGSMADSATDPDPGLARVPVLPGTDRR